MSDDEIQQETLDHVAEVANRPEVKKVIRALRRLEKIWPHDQPIWLASLGASFQLMADHKDGSRTRKFGGSIAEEGMDPDLTIASYSIPHEGGDW